MMMQPALRNPAALLSPGISAPTRILVQLRKADTPALAERPPSWSRNIVLSEWKELYIVGIHVICISICNTIIYSMKALLQTLVARVRV